MTPERFKELETLAVMADGHWPTPYQAQVAIEKFEFAMYPKDVVYFTREIRDLRQKLKEAQKDAALERIAMRFVDRAGDYYPGDPAERICDEFNAAIGDEVERQRAAIVKEKA